MDRLVKEIQQRARQQHLNQNQLAELTGTHQGTISKWFSGERKPKLDNLMKLGRALGFEIVVRDTETGEEIYKWE